MPKQEPLAHPSHCHQLPWVLGPGSTPREAVSDKKRLSDPWVSSPHPGPLKGHRMSSVLGQARARSLSIRLSGKELAPQRPPPLALEGGGGFLA